MSRILSTEAICLRHTPWRETSKMVSFFTRDFGRILLCAKGARRPGSQFGAALEVLTHSRIIFYRREARRFNILSDAEILDDFPILRTHLHCLRAGGVVTRFTERYFELDAPSRAVFVLLRQTLQALNSCCPAADAGVAWPSRNTSAVAAAYLFRAAGLLGYEPQLRHCVLCQRRKATAFSSRFGGLLCSNCLTRDPDAVRVSAEVLQTLHSLYRSGLKLVVSMKLPEDSAYERALEVINRHLGYHFDGFTLGAQRQSASRAEYRMAGSSRA